MFAYCGNNPIILSDNNGLRPVNLYEEELGYIEAPKTTKSKQRAINPPTPASVNPSYPDIQADTQENGFTLLLGLSGRAAFGGAVNASLYLAIDIHGSIVIYVAGGGGGGFPSASLSTFGGIISAPNASYLAGVGLATGGSVGEGLGIGGDYIIAVDQERNTSYHGGIGCLGVIASAPIPVEWHEDLSFSYPLIQTSILDLFFPKVISAKSILGGMYNGN